MITEYFLLSYYGKGYFMKKESNFCYLMEKAIFVKSNFYDKILLFDILWKKLFLFKAILTFYGKRLLFDFL
jgi:hypothetical protein